LVQKKKREGEKKRQKGIRARHGYSSEQTPSSTFCERTIERKEEGKKQQLIKSRSVVVDEEDEMGWGGVFFGGRTGFRRQGPQWSRALPQSRSLR
jgi:hypothetical protein